MTAQRDRDRTGRPTPDDRLGNRARMLLRSMQRYERLAAEATQHADLDRSELAEIHELAEERLGRAIPLDALLLDVLELIDIEDGDVWRWRGARNNHGVPTMRVERSEKTIARYLGIMFGLISDEDVGVFYPDEGADADDVNPWHRTLRAQSRHPGNPNRYGFAVPAHDE